MEDRFVLNCGIREDHTISFVTYYRATLEEVQELLEERYKTWGDRFEVIDLIEVKQYYNVKIVPKFKIEKSC